MSRSSKMYTFLTDSAIRRHVLSRYTLSYCIVYSSNTGSSAEAARIFNKKMEHFGSGSIRNASTISIEELSGFDIVVILISTITDGKPPADGESFCASLEDLAYDFRVDKSLLEKLRFAVVGFGCEHYGSEYFCTPAKKVDAQLARLGGLRLAPLQLITDTQDNVVQVERAIQQVTKAVDISFSKDNEEKAPIISTDTPSGSEDESEEVPVEPELENADGCVTSREMVTDRQRKQLEKEGYKIIGSHSAVKLCRWTKHHARGRGGCYKHTFYGISSRNCMEATPSLACANKCTFCWRHHKNPVGTSWQWDTDDAGFIVQEAVTKHLEMIKQLRGVPGVTDEKFSSAMSVKHCALSLVGEPIMYPQIDTLLELLHNRRISTFLVTNAQFPEAIRSLRPVTQLYVSVDAADPVTLKAVDRPLFSDYWERFIASLVSLKKKRQRTVYRLTLVKTQNMDDVQAYVDLVSLGEPSFIEIKSVTYCGTSTGASDITMSSVPYHEEVKKFGEAMVERLGGRYEMACEHKHSCSVLLAQKKFKIDNVWHTWIDYDKFAELASSGRADFGVEEYWAPTPSWAVYGAEEQGFDPVEVRHYRNKQ